MKRRRRGQGTLESDSASVERELRRLVPAAVHRGLGERILDRAAEVRRAATLRPWMRLAAAACSVLIVAVLALDPVLARHEAARMASILDGRPAASPEAEDAAVLAEAVGGTGGAAEASRTARLGTMIAASSRQELGRRAIEGRRRLKGWLEHEISEDPE